MRHDIPVALVFRRSSEDSGCPLQGCYKDCSTPPDMLCANPDVGGLGVLVGFLATGWLVVILVIFHYFLAFDPSTDPLANADRDRRYGHRQHWRPNAVDVKTISMFSGLRQRLGHQSHWNMALTKILLKMCDIQLLTGFGLLFTGFVNLNCYISAYHWQILSYLAWFSNLTHAACLTALREHMCHHQMERNFRMILMFILLAGLITAIVPTGYFNWDRRSIDIQGTASKARSNARCFFSRTTILASLEKPNSGLAVSPWATTAYESSVLSIILLTFSFFTRSIKMFRSLSEIVKDTIRQYIGRWATSCLTATAKGCRQFGTTPFRRKLLAVFRPLDAMIGVYLVVKLYLEMLTSEMADIFWLFISSAWGTVRLFLARSSAEVDGSENEWAFGQVLPVFLLLGPIMMVSLAIFATARKQSRLENQEQDAGIARQAVTLYDTDQADIMVTRATSSSVRDRSVSLRHMSAESTTSSLAPMRGSTRAQPEVHSSNGLRISDAGTRASAGVPLELLPLSSIRSGANGRTVTLMPNQDTATEIEDIDMRASLAFRFSQSQWMTIVMWLFYLQFFTMVGTVFAFIVVGPPRAADGPKPSYYLKDSAFAAFVVQPLNCFVAVVLGLHVRDGQTSKLHLTLLCILIFIFLFGWSAFTALPWQIYPKWGCLCPLVITAVQFMFLSLR